MSNLNLNNKVRVSNFELLRIIAMVMVLILHADFVALGNPDSVEIQRYPIVSVIRIFFEVTSIVAVNVFVLISGWFSIKVSIKGFCKFSFQTLFFSIGIYLIMLLLGMTELSPKGIASCFAITQASSYWFIPAYICLYLLSPVLNKFIESTDKRTFLYVLITFFVFQTIYGFLGNSAGFLVKGYSTMSFIGLYLLAAFFRKYKCLLNYSKVLDIVGYGVMSLILTLIYLISVLKHISFVSDRLFVYSNPLIICLSVLLFSFFNKVRLNSKIINKVGNSCYAVYLLHCNPNMFQVYVDSVRNVVLHQTLSEFLHVLGIIGLWFVSAIILDQFRLFAWERILLKWNQPKIYQRVINKDGFTEREDC